MKNTDWILVIKNKYSAINTFIAPSNFIKHGQAPCCFFCLTENTIVHLYATVYSIILHFLSPEPTKLSLNREKTLDVYLN